MAVSPLAPFALGKMLKAGAQTATVIGLYVALILLAVLVVPATIMLLTQVFAVDVSVPIGGIARLVLVSVLAPLVAGMVVARLAPSVAPRLARIAALTGNLLILPVLAFFLAVSGGAMLALVGNGALFAIVLALTAGLAAGHFLGGPDPANRRALALAAATRHPGIAALIAHRNFDDRRVVLAVVLFLLVSMLVSALYQRWTMRSPASAAPTASTPNAMNRVSPHAAMGSFPD
jgi:BASS family bile acid:Na+ symporter